MPIHNGRVYLRWNVGKTDYHERMQIKKAGAQFDKVKQRWYVPPYVKLAEFGPWLLSPLHIDRSENNLFKQMGARWDDMTRYWYLRDIREKLDAPHDRRRVRYQGSACPIPEKAGFLGSPHETLYLKDYITKSSGSPCEFSALILEAKNGNANAISQFADIIGKKIEKHCDVPDSPFVVTCVPSSKRGKESSMNVLAQCLAERSTHYEYVKGLLRRTEDVEAAHLGGPRNYKTHYDSLDVALFFRDEDLDGRDVILLDDVTTTQKSISVSKNILRQVCKPPRTITCICLGRTKKQNFGKW